MPERDKFSLKPDLPLGTYRHYKGGEYQALTLACDEATHEWLVVYRALYTTGDTPNIWVRTYYNFIETVETDNGPVPRFTPMSLPDSKLAIGQNYLARIEASVGTTMFQHIYVKDGDQLKDVAEAGSLSCAQYVSSILTLAGLIDRPHATVKSTIAAMKNAGWYETDTPLPGAVVCWPAGVTHNEHIGFCLGSGKFVSNSTEKRVPVIHSEVMSDGRRPIAFYTHKGIE